MKTDKIEKIERLVKRIEKITERLEGKKENVSDSLRAAAHAIIQYLDNEQFDEEIEEFISDFVDLDRFGIEDEDEVIEDVKKIRYEIINYLKTKYNI